MPTSKNKTETTPRKSGKAKGSKPGASAQAGEGARSPNRDEATSASTRARPATAPRNPVAAGAQAAAEQRRAAGKSLPLPPESPASDAVAPRWAQAGDRLTTAQGLRVDDADNSLTIGERGPTLLEDFHLREKITHFDHERIPERVVHARGAGAHGVFEVSGGLEDLCAAAFLQSGAQTPVFVRFSTVAGSRGSADTVRDVRGFATKFYTDEGNFDLVGNNIPVFFIQDGLKFPDVIHAVKPEPDREIPQAQSAHDTFWDFVSLQPESTHMLMWVMSDRAIPRSYATMEGFGVHTFRLTAVDGTTSLVKFHWKPVAGVHGLVWEESQKLCGIDPDFHRRDLHARIETETFPQWELGVQVMPDTADETFEGIDLLDATKLVPEEMCPVRIVGTMTLTRNPTNYFAETEQVAFHPGHLVPGVGIVDDPLLHARLFSYLDTQLTRLGGPNFAQLPINRPIAPVNDNNRDGFGQQAVHEGVTPYTPNSVGAGCPFAEVGDGVYTHPPRQVSGQKLKLRPASFDDHYSQAAMFYRSLTDIEQDHIIGAFSFELGKCISPQIQVRMLDNLARVDNDLSERVAAHLGLAAPEIKAEEPSFVSPALSMVLEEPSPVSGRVVALLAGDETTKSAVATWRTAADPLGVEIVVVGPRFGSLDRGVTVDRSVHVTDPVEYDGVVLATAADETVAQFTQEAYRHHKAIAVADAAVAEALGLVFADDGVTDGPETFFEAMALHRDWNR